MAESRQVETGDELIEWVRDARQRTFDLVSDLTDDQLIGPKLPTINPLVWEIGHAAWFQEQRVLRHCGGMQPIRNEVDDLYDSIAIEHDVRWDLPLLSRQEVMAYITEVRDRCIDLLCSASLTDELRYFVKLSIFHEDMHTEAFTYTRQTLAYPAPRFSIEGTERGRDSFSVKSVGELRLSSPIKNPDPLAATRRCALQLGDANIPGGKFLLGAQRDASFVFDNEQWAHEVTVRPFAISRTAVTQGEFSEFVTDGGYTRRDLWCDEGWQWHESTNAVAPLYWRQEANGRWQRRVFDRWVSLEANLPMLHVNWYEAQAYCRWANRRLPTEREWEAAAAGSMAEDSSKLSSEKRRYPWGNQPPESLHANLDWQAMGTVDVNSLEAGDSAFGCRQMIGNVWEWTDSTFVPYPGFEVGPYREYSSTSFGECKVLRGGCWTTRSRMMWNTWRNFYRPDRRDVWNGFRTCATDTE